MSLLSVLRERFAFDSAYLIGSVLGDSYTPHSDLDIILRGLKPDEFLKAYACLLQNCDHQLDVKPFEELSVEFQEEVLQKEMRLE